ncbi:sensor histidine kinase [Clostridium thailandense]|uniref:sensor histidine kinase n=1 Tax=Clostridium thailandense TaxID=2794346 RepID=UPI0039890A5D
MLYRILSNPNGKEKIIRNKYMSLRKKNENLQKNYNEFDFKTEFLSNISHEFNTPLTLILSILQFMEISAEKEIYNYDSEKCKKYIGIMKKNCFRLIKLTNNIIELSKIANNEINSTFMNYNIVNIVKGISLSSANYAEKKGIGLTFDTSIEKKIVSCDKEMLEKIMLNLLSNAVKFTEPGGNIKVRIEDKLDSVDVLVSDTGMGIPEYKLKEIFSPFAQMDKSFRRNHEGCGIGLTLVKALVELLGGKIKLYSKLGEGTNVVVNIPTNVVDNSIILKNDFISYYNDEKVKIEFSDICSFIE